MKVFLSWSGHQSHEIALILRDWLPVVIQSIEPYVSSEDIDKGTRWSIDIAKELELSHFGIICVTKENIDSPWLNFEAGALSKTIDSSKVCPFLFGIKRSEVQGPLLQFQSTIFEKEDFKKLLQGINSSLKEDALEPHVMEKSFEMWWNELKVKLEALTKAEGQEVNKSIKASSIKNSEISYILEEILQLVRTQQKLLHSPEELFPREYFHNVIEMINISNKRIPHYSKHSLNSIHRLIHECQDVVSLCVSESNRENLLKLETKFKELHSVFCKSFDREFQTESLRLF